MKVKELIGELRKSSCYGEFKEEYKNSFFCAGFFVLSRDEKEGDKFQIDFLLPDEKRMVSFEYPFNSYKVHDDEVDGVLKVSDLDLKLDLDSVSEFVRDEFKRDFSKIIAILQNGLWNITCIEGIDIKRLKVDAYTGEVKSSGDLKMSDIMSFEKT